MASPLDSSAPRVADLLLKKFGKVAKLVKTTRGEYDPATGDGDDDASVEYGLRAYWRRFREHERLGEITAKDILVLISAIELPSGVVPEAKDRLELLGVKTEILDVDPVYSGERVALYRIRSRS
jgi:hypothetical protein